jgi:hypothetical protein
MAEMTAKDRQRRASIAANASWANTADPSARTAPARHAAMSRFERQVDPEGVLAPAERHRRAESARKAFYVAMTYKSARVRAARKEAAQAAQNGSGPRPKPGTTSA